MLELTRTHHSGSRSTPFFGIFNFPDLAIRLSNAECQPVIDAADNLCVDVNSSSSTDHISALEVPKYILK